MHLSISEVMKCPIQEVRNLPFFTCMAHLKAWGKMNNTKNGIGKEEDLIDADNPANTEKIEKMLKDS